jgi:acyl-coenzyme A synthetase/AMP-(fatty) acid ligase
MVLEGRDPVDPLILDNGRYLSVGEFLARARRVAAQFDAGRQVLNLCDRRPAFLAGFVAALHARCTTLLPTSRSPEVIQHMRTLYPDCLSIDDRDIEAPARSADHAPMGQIPEDQLVMIGFTSGSTGQPSHHEKIWRSLAAVTARNNATIRAALPRHGAQRMPWIVGTVPSQHMYGMELTVLLPLLGHMGIHAGRPLLPTEVAATLDAVPSPRILVSTPAHLRAIVASGVPLPRTEVTVSATAPLDETLARAVEAATQGVLVEMFGSTETCILGTRRTAVESSWRPYPGVRFSAAGQGTRVDAPWFAGSEHLQDVIETDLEGTFRLVGRSADLIEVAGKRASLADLTQRVLRVPGVVDAVVFQPDASRALVRRLAAFVVAPGQTAASIRAALESAIDPAFMPRPLLIVAALPRTAAGKLPLSALEAALRDHQQDL